MKRSDEHGPQREPGAAAKRRYEKPRILAREQLEALASVCTPGKSNFAQCGAGPINS
jgi:hypothetical protein